jgi:uncharacterized Ntn-hydrolase superfamily protein
VAFDPITNELGVAVQSKYFSVGTDVPWARAGVGAVATQATVNPAFGPRALAMLKKGIPASQVMKTLSKNDPQWQNRQVGIVDFKGRAVSHTGKSTITWAGGEAGTGFAVQGNILAGPQVVSEMARAFRQTRGELGERLIAALEAGQAAGGDKRGQQSASLLVVRPSKTNPEFEERYVDLRVEDHPTPIKELRRLWQIRQGFKGADVHLLYAKQYDSAGRKDLAAMERSRVRDILTNALARDEKDPGMLNGLAWACATNSIFLKDALKAAERAVDLAPSNVDILDTLAEVHFRLGNAKKAIEVEERAARIDPKSQYLKDQLRRFRRGK